MYDPDVAIDHHEGIASPIRGRIKTGERTERSAVAAYKAFNETYIAFATCRTESTCTRCSAVLSVRDSPRRCSGPSEPDDRRRAGSGSARFGTASRPGSPGFAQACRPGCARARSIAAHRWMRPPGRHSVGAAPAAAPHPGRAASGSFDSWRGKYADSPRAISEELHRRDPSFRHVWVVEEDDPLVPEWVEVVRPNRWSHLHALGRARYIVANSGMPIYWRKKPDSVPTNVARHAAEEDRLRHRNPQMADADGTCGTSRETSRTGICCFPRIRSAPRSSVARSATKGRFSRPAIREMICSARCDPTTFGTEPARPRLGSGCLAPSCTRRPGGTMQRSSWARPGTRRDLGPDIVFLLRAHNSVAGTVEAQEHPRVLDVSMVPDTRELLSPPMYSSRTTHR